MNDETITITKTKLREIYDRLQEILRILRGEKRE